MQLVRSQFLRVVKRVRFIKRAQVLGFTLDEVGSLLELDEANACADTRALAANKLQVIEGKLADLKAMRKALTALLRQCETGSTDGSCPIIHALAADGCSAVVASPGTCGAAAACTASRPL